jgi:hypothetical protein
MSKPYFIAKKKFFSTEMLEGGEMPKTSLTFVLDSNTILRSILAITKLVPLGNNRLSFQRADGM